MSDTVKQLTERQMEQQDAVDNEIHNLLCHLAGKELEWDIEVIGEVRDRIAELFEAAGIMTEMEFYPYIEGEKDG